jgi:hypothetical protein
MAKDLQTCAFLLLSLARLPVPPLPQWYELIDYTDVSLLEVGARIAEFGQLRP